MIGIGRPTSTTVLPARVSVESRPNTSREVARPAGAGVGCAVPNDTRTTANSLGSYARASSLGNILDCNVRILIRAGEFYFP